MSHRFSIFAVPAAIAVVTLSLPSSGSAQEVFQLVSVAGEPLPVVTEQEEDCREELLAATLTLQPDGIWTLATSERDVCGDRVETDEDREDGTFTADGQTVQFFDEDGNREDDDDDEDELDVDELAVGTRSPGAIVVRLADGRTDLEFRQ